MAVTEAALQALIQDQGYGTDTATVQARAIQSTWRRVLGMRRWAFLDATANVTATTGSETVSLSSITDFGRIKRVRIISGTDRYDALDYRTSGEIRDLLSENADQCAPEYWSLWAGAVLLFPRPDKAYTVTIDYVKKPAYSTTDIVFPEMHQDVLVWGAVASLAYRQREYTAAAYAQNEYQSRLQEMIRAYALEQEGVREVARSDWWGDAEA